VTLETDSKLFSGSDDPLLDRGIALQLFDERLIKKVRQPSLLSSVHGRIETVLLTLPSWILRYQRQPEIRSSSAAVWSLLQQLPDTAEYTIVTHEEAEAELEVWLDELNASGRARVLTAPNKMRFGSWPQDGFAVCVDRSDSRRYLLEPVPYRSPEDACIPGMIAASAAAERTQVPLCFEGGNMLVGDDFWLLGMDSAVQSVKLGLIDRQGQETRRQALHRVFTQRVEGERKLHLIGSRIPVPGFEREALVRKMTIDGHTWDEVLYRGNGTGTVQPIFHIDAFVTLAGRGPSGVYTVLVGDPGMAAELLNQEPWPHATQAVFDDIAEQLTILGFNVVRNPLPLAYHDDEIHKVRAWYFATANNALVEIADATRTVWLPCYGNSDHPELETTDKKNEEIWRGLGFDVQLLADFHPFARNLGAAHCIAKCLAREASP
jgi:hypothetical protein